MSKNDTKSETEILILIFVLRIEFTCLESRLIMDSVKTK